MMKFVTIVKRVVVAAGLSAVAVCASSTASIAPLQGRLAFSHGAMAISSQSEGQTVGVPTPFSPSVGRTTEPGPEQSGVPQSTELDTTSSTTNTQQKTIGRGSQFRLQDVVRSVPLLQQGAKGEGALWLNEALASLRYLPVIYAPTTSSDSLLTGLQNGTLRPTTGNWTWSVSYPLSLMRLWNANVFTVVTRGALMTFQSQHGLAVDGVAGPEVYTALYHALQSTDVNKKPYTYIIVTKAGPQHLDVYQNGQKVYSSLANTGISASPTPNGTFAVYLRYQSQTMQGKTPWGATYRDPGVPWVSYFDGGCAIHGFPRASYGSPQSLGCVELPISAAAHVYGLMDYGTLVTILA